MKQGVEWYLATGIQFRQLAFSFRISKSAISTIVPQVCKAIWTQLVRKHMPEPSEDSFKNIAQCFWDRWQFPNCIGCIDGKHIRIIKPKKSGSMYYNYKSFFSIGLLAVTDPNYKFVMINVGSYGKDNDAGVFEECPFRIAIEQGRLKIPKEQVLPGSNIIAPYVLLGDAAIPLKKYLLRPFPEKSTVKGDAKDNYNYRLSRARMVVECSFGSITSKFRILHKSIETNVTNAVHIVKAICLLHNIIRYLESINENELMSFRKTYQNMSQTQRHNSQRRYNATSRAAAQARENFKLCFVQHPLLRM
ncbi:putative nuclease HARBI1 isoform X10 [Leptidea sinapis]|uniref:putative nuclease HARBI1 isoform X1 n=1 Tax=Leptidea sinapis TaxID=189913 RepID=UPI0021C33520|nr:putative nuclease HARBI1 isoform X1 [Leptidea sinapis]XP_050676562.1 putative nuclease HARBI1 isoform X5 [Leptidea sinapis]XP_050676563.1 putative nuclease HARBI1 isoform X6 [Leptidea sinapis]XP_050676564.1 putative nuclease HARBI1 isoform X7 [Leptidea sinapis]XP_050676565.1 putative nuclease HARBI1 isoform X8 [Leptidea sinapis]XP_050676566.1 putative nuclease HARBI1 isoform X9 [Leptidea sinapis]XP_050676567.1 putative nuclease HARBI1 isoform X10 [Leptidea sinapis]